MRYFGLVGRWLRCLGGTPEDQETAEENAEPEVDRSCKAHGDAGRSTKSRFPEFHLGLASAAAGAAAAGRGVRVTASG
jgi:hypothetical protein